MSLLEGRVFIAEPLVGVQQILNLANGPIDLDESASGSDSDHRNEIEDCMAGCEEQGRKARINQSLREGACTCWFLLGLNVACTIVFAVRGLVSLQQMNTNSGSMSEIGKGFGTAITFFIVGVVLPSWARVVATSKAATSLMTLRHYFLRDAPKQHWTQLYFRLSFCIMPIAVASGVAAMILACVQLNTIETQDDGTYIGSPLSGWLFLSLFVWFTGTLSFGHSKVEEIAIEASTVCILGIVRMIETKSHECMSNDTRDSGSDSRSCCYGGAHNDHQVGAEPLNNPNWRTISAIILLAHEVLGNIWDITFAGGLAITRITILFAASIVVAAIAIGQRAQSLAGGWLLQVVGFVFAAIGVMILARLASVTSLCMDPRVRSIASSTAAFMVHRKAENNSDIHDAACYQNILTWLQWNTFGIAIAGVPITKQLVISMASKMLLYVPVAIALVRRLLYPDGASA